MKARTTLELDPELIDTAMKLSGAKTKTQVIEKALEELIRHHRIDRLIGLLGTLDSVITPEELDEMRHRDLNKPDMVEWYRYQDELAEDR